MNRQSGETTQADGWYGFASQTKMIAWLVTASITVAACGIFNDPADGFDVYIACADGTPNCIEVQVRAKAQEYEVQLVSETDSEIRVRLTTTGAPGGNDDGHPSFQVHLKSPLGDRVVIDDTRDLPAERLQ